MPKLHVFTVVSDATFAESLLTSALKSDLKINIVTIPVWTGYVDKLFSMRAAIADIPETDVVCFVDAYDVIAFSNAAEILAKFVEYNCDLLISAELNMYPDSFESRYAALYSARPIVDHNYKYVNSGGYIGYRRALDAMYSWKPDDEIRQICADGGDQTYVSDYFLAFTQDVAANICIDEYQKIFQNMCKVDMTAFEFVNGRIQNKVMNQSPCFMHFNGFNAYNMQIKHLGTEECSDLRVVFADLRAQSELSKEPVHVWYDVPHYIVYRSRILCNLPQKPGDDASFKG